MSEIIYVAVVPPAGLDAELAGKVAALINKDRLFVSRLLSAGIPRIIARFDNSQEAESILRKLQTLDLSAFLMTDAELRQPFKVFKAYSLECGKERITFLDRAGSQLKIESPNAFLIIKGISETSEEKEITTTRKTINITATLLTGGIPIRRTIREKTKQTSTRAEHFLRLYEKPPSDRCIEILSHGFNFSGLGTEMAQSSLINFNLLAAKMKETFAEAFFYEGIKESTATAMAYVSRMQNLDVSCRLIYSYHRIYR